MCPRSVASYRARVHSNGKGLPPYGEPGDNDNAHAEFLAWEKASNKLVRPRSYVARAERSARCKDMLRIACQGDDALEFFVQFPEGTLPLRGWCTPRGRQDGGLAQEFKGIWPAGLLSALTVRRIQCSFLEVPMCA